MNRAGPEQVLTEAQRKRAAAHFCACGCYWCPACREAWVPAEAAWMPGPDGVAPSLPCPLCKASSQPRTVPPPDPLVRTAHVRIWADGPCRARGFRQRQSAGLVRPARDRARQHLLDQAAALEASARRMDALALQAQRDAANQRAKAADLRARAAGQQAILPCLG